MADRLFQRFVAMYGTQKVMAMWADTDMDAVKDTWAAAISRYSPHSIAVAVGDLLDSGREWPPTLPEFRELCRRGALTRQQQQAPTLPAPRQTTREEAAEILRRVGAGDVLAKRGDPRAWARRILERVAAGEPVPIACVQMAQRAVEATRASA